MKSAKESRSFGRRAKWSLIIFAALLAPASLLLPGGSAQEQAQRRPVPDVARMVGPVSQATDLRGVPYVPPKPESEEVRLTRPLPGEGGRAIRGPRAPRAAERDSDSNAERGNAVTPAPAKKQSETVKAAKPARASRPTRRPAAAGKETVGEGEGANAGARAPPDAPRRRLFARAEAAERPRRRDAQHDADLRRHDLKPRLRRLPAARHRRRRRAEPLRAVGQLLHPRPRQERQRPRRPRHLQLLLLRDGHLDALRQQPQRRRRRGLLRPPGRPRGRQRLRLLGLPRRRPLLPVHRRLEDERPRHRRLLALRRAG